MFIPDLSIAVFEDVTTDVWKLKFEISFGLRSKNWMCESVLLKHSIPKSFKEDVSLVT